MSAAGVADTAVKAIKSGQYEFVLVNFANPDMVGHTLFRQAMIAVATVDDCTRRVVEPR